MLNYALRSKAIAFRRPLPLVSVSLGGTSSPKVYSYQDILLSQGSGFVPSALSTINGETASKYIEDLSQLGALNDPDALYNSMFFSPGFEAEAPGWQGKLSSRFLLCGIRIFMTRRVLCRLWAVFLDLPWREHQCHVRERYRPCRGKQGCGHR